MAPAILYYYIIADTTPIPCLHSCDNKCLTSKQLCDGRSDCTDRSDEPAICRKETVLSIYNINYKHAYSIKHAVSIYIYY